MHSLRLLWAANREQACLRRRQRRNRRSRSMEEIAEMSELEFIQQFRLNKHTFSILCGDLRRLDALKETPEIPLEDKVLCTLSFLATGSYQRIVGLTQHIVQRTVSMCIQQVLDGLTHPDMLKKWIVFPHSLQERTCIRQEFHRKFQLPSTMGCIDCTHVAIVKPSQDEHLYFNRKGFHSLNVQMVCDTNMKILNVNAKFGGATHDSFIWAASRVEPFMRELHRNGEQVWLLGDSGYPLRPWLLTPILGAEPGSREERYTQRHVQARNCIERCFGLLKSRWRCLLRHRTLHYQPVKAGKIVLACSVLHNMAIEARLPLSLPLEDEGEAPSSEASENISSDTSQTELLQGRAIRTSLLIRL